MPPRPISRTTSYGPICRGTSIAGESCGGSSVLRQRARSCESDFALHAIEHVLLRLADFPAGGVVRKQSLRRREPVLVELHVARVRRPGHDPFPERPRLAI